MKKLGVQIYSVVALSALAGLAACGGGDRASRTLIQNKGSDTLVNVAQAWAEAYKEVDPNVAVAVSGGGSGTGISALINGTVDLANTSRKMKEKELTLAATNGVEAREFVVGYDALGVFLHEDNPIEELSLEQLAGVYGEDGEIVSWSQLGVTVPGCDSDEIVLISRQNNSGTFVYFKEAVLGKERNFKLGSRDLHGSKDVVDLVEHTPCAIGYSGLAYAREGVKAVCITTVGGSEDEPAGCVSPSVATAVNKTYPIARPLLMYSRGEPQGAVKAYLDWVLSDIGQCIIQDKGYAPAQPVVCGEG